jgi:hypothetical protein
MLLNDTTFFCALMLYVVNLFDPDEVLEFRFVSYTVYAHTPTTVWTDSLLFIYLFFILVQSVSDAAVVLGGNPCLCVE